ncbi:MAG: pyridoxal phosphate-dependent aminotransferase [Proteobacteria bacterium]|nr:pyridoxal phosphate-dependent aminotransferase [Pseudomonadota bacterium]
MDIQLSNRVQRIKPSPTLAVSARATELKAQGKDIIDLGVGEPDFDTPEHIKQSGIKAIQEGFTKYTAVDGTAGLKQAIIEKFSRDNGLDYKPNQILVSCGGKQSFFNLCQAFINEGDEVIIPAPYWVSYPDMVLIAGGNPVIITADIKQNYKITPEQLEKAITPKTRLFVINSPSNPTGVAYTKAELAALAKVLLKHPHVLVATDDMYEHILWAKEPFINILNACPELYDRTIVLNGVSKAYAMTGWRIGYAAGPVKLIAAMKNVQSQSTSNPTSISQKAAEFALKSDQSSIKEMVKAFKERHDFVCNRLKAMPGVECIPADGAFYLFPNMQKVIDQLPNVHNDVEFTEHVLMTVGVALVPGSAFGAPGCVRLSIATSMSKLEDALNRLEKVISGKNS